MIGKFDFEYHITVFSDFFCTGADTSYWIKFFTECGIPPSESTNYAITFTDNRIQKDMLMDLTKEYLTEMGISILGDVIAILKHAKAVHSQVNFTY